MRIEDLFYNSNQSRQNFILIDDCCEWTHQDLLLRIDSLRSVLVGKGVQHLERVAVICENGSSFLVALMAVLSIGAVAVLIDPQIPRVGIEDMMLRVGVKFVCASGIKPEHSLIEDGDLRYQTVLCESRADWKTEARFEYNKCTFGTGTDLDPAVILFSSGTTGAPKGVVLTHRAILINLEAIIDYMQPTEQDRFLITKTMVHCSTLTGEVLVALAVGATLIVQNPVVPPTIILKRIAQFRPSIVFVNPTILQLLVQIRQKKYDLSSLRLLYTSGSIAGKELLVEAQRIFPNVAILNVYGLTEAGPRVAAQRLNDGPIKPGSVGKPIKGVTVVIKDNEGEEITGLSGKTGLVYVKSLSLMQEYWNDPQATSQKISNGWLKTGDLGFIDGDGELFIMGRADEIIIRGSHNVDPYRIENLIRTIPGILNCIVFGVPDQLHGQRIVCGYQKSKNGPSCETIMAHCINGLAAYECPQEIHEWLHIPTTIGGKISRRLAANYYLECHGK